MHLKNLVIISFLLISANSFSQIVINEYSASNWKQFQDNHNDYEDWFELYNNTASSVDLTGYFLSDDIDALMQWEMPSGTTIEANGVLRFWCSGRGESSGTNFHTNFKLTQTKQNPDKIILSDPSGNILDSLTIQITQTHHAWARNTDGSSEWKISTSPTPNATNNIDTKYIDYTDRPTFSVAGGFFTESFYVHIETSELDAEIRYTIDGTTPTNTSNLYLDSILITETTVLKAKVFSNNVEILEGLMMYQTYFMNISHTLPVVSIAGNQLQQLADGNESLKPIASIEIYNQFGESKTRSYGEMNSHGQDSWANDQRSLDWVSRDEFGYSRHLKEKFFSTTEREEFQRMIFRAAGDDNYPAAHHWENEGCAHMRDDYVQMIAKEGGLHVDVRTSARCIVYLNGEYWGIYSYREKTDDHDFTEYYYGQDKYHIQYQMTWGETWSEYGGVDTQNDWQDLRDLVEENDMVDTTYYNQANQLLDFYSLVDYFVANTTPVTTDWLIYNTAVWRGLNPDADHQKWGYTMWDNDATFGFYINYSGAPNTGTDATPCDVDDYNPAWFPSSFFDGEGHVRLLNKLRDNPEFEQFYLSRYADLFNTTYSCENMLYTLDSMMNIFEPEMEMHAERWYGTYDEWNENFLELRDFIEDRCTLLNVGLSDCYDLTEPFDVVFKVEPPEAGHLFINTLEHYDLPWNAKYFGGMYNIMKAIPTDESWHFWYWESEYGSFDNIYDALTNLTLTANDTIVAYFGKDEFVGIPYTEPLNFTVEIAPSVFNYAFAVNYSLEENSDLMFNLFSTDGKRMKQVNLSNQTIGNHSYTFDVSDSNLASGIYLFQFQTNSGVQNYKVVKM